MTSTDPCYGNFIYSAKITDACGGLNALIYRTMILVAKKILLTVSKFPIKPYVLAKGNGFIQRREIFVKIVDTAD